MATPAAPILFLLQRAPYGTAATRDLIDAILACASFDQAVQVLFTDEGVWSLLPEQHGEAIAMKDIGKLLAAFPYYDIHALYADATALAQRGLDVSTLTPGVQVVEGLAMQALLRQAAQVVSL